MSVICRASFVRLVRYSIGKAESYGVLLRDAVLALPELARQLGEKLPSNLEQFVDLDLNYLKKAEFLIQSAKKEEVASSSHLLKDVRLLAPLPKPGKIVCLGLNYYDHAAETNMAVPTELIVFMKPYTAIIGPDESIVKPSVVEALDYEGELSIVVGRRAKGVPLTEIASHIFGYTIMNDVSARDIQFRISQWTKGKSFDTFAPTGPCITTANELSQTSDLAIRTWVNGEIRQNSSTSKMVFNVQEIVHRLNCVMSLEPGDIIATGTPAGVGFTLKPNPVFLQHGDIVKIDIQGIGFLENKVVDQRAPPGKDCV